MSTAKETAIGVGWAALILFAVGLSTVSVLLGLDRISGADPDTTRYWGVLAITPTLLGLAGVILLARRWTDHTARASGLVAGVILLPPVSVVLAVVYRAVVNRNLGSS